LSRYNVAVVGAAGLVGTQILKVMAERRFPLGELCLLATTRSAGRRIPFNGRELVVQETTVNSFDDIDIAFFCASKSASRELAPVAVSKGAVVIDKSNAFRMDPDVPLAVPEVNPRAIARHKGIVASPNCSTIQMVVALKPLHDAARIKRIVVSTYQAVSGTGRDALVELEDQSKEVLEGKEVTRSVYPHQIAFNVIPHIDAFDINGYSGEEMKMVRETQKIFEDESISISPTTVRVPVYMGHAESIMIETEKKLSAEAARDILRDAPGVVVVDDPGNGEYPMPIDCAGRDEVFVGRVREDLFCEKGLLLWVVADNLRKGAATNAVQIAEYLIQNDLLAR